MRTIGSPERDALIYVTPEKSDFGVAGTERVWVPG
jgi:hypothetical protein